MEEKETEKIDPSLEKSLSTRKDMDITVSYIIEENP